MKKTILLLSTISLLTLTANATWAHSIKQTLTSKKPHSISHHAAHHPMITQQDRQLALKHIELTHLTDKQHDNQVHTGSFDLKGKTYKGDYKNGKAHGKGELILKTGETYKGHFKNGKAEGLFKIKLKSKKVMLTAYKNGEILKK